MASFLHARAGGFSSGDLTTWYASSGIEAAIAEVPHHAIGEMIDRGADRAVRVYRECLADLEGRYEDLRGAPFRQ
ncbi:hypothetical protein L288_13045 [Sphingobium quisquiliarum P25]|uniref:Uncharacterized protein n=1 Tax=Sphingobium quisquiliarum P25 TaxID=1329909 RepID=T0GZK9_9SPHN|nr:hypothetical protein [Sphingobium quisquiliarum]EQB05333.1 hypothetical protein L288_13045 [Sphingobium quisquiliarum P25]EZP72036.1 hypothetical protein BV96_02167 [Sphingomonas paucimobilis]